MFFRKKSKGLVIFLLFISIVLVYISVVLGEECPNIFCTYLKFTLFSIQCVANKCRKVRTVNLGFEVLGFSISLKMEKQK